MPYVTRSRVNFTGFDDATIARPKFIYFKVIGLRPQDRHFFYFDGVNVTNYVNTDEAVDDFYGLPRNSNKRNPGDKYITETGFPTELGGPTAEIFSDTNGTIEGVFYLQSNDDLNFPTGNREFTVLNISEYDIAGSTSTSTEIFTIDGGIENYETEYYKVYVAPAKPRPATTSTGGSGGTGPGGNSVKDTNKSTGDKCFTGEHDKPKTFIGKIVHTVGHIVSGIAKAVSSVVKVISKCCFIMLESRYGDGTMDEVVRRYRDEKMTERNRRGYYKVAEVLVPMMRKSKVVKWLVAKTMTDPLVSYGKYYYGKNKHGWIFKPVEKFWMWVFDTVGEENVQFIRENGEII